MHRSQSMHRLCSIIKSSSSTVIQSGGHTAMHAEQKSHLFLSTDIIFFIKRWIFNIILKKIV